MMPDYKRVCPLCNKLLVYTNKYLLKAAEYRNSNCKSCKHEARITNKVEPFSEFINDDGITIVAATDNEQIDIDAFVKKYHDWKKLKKGNN